MELQQNKVVVVIPVYKTEKYVEETVKSVINQSYKNVEIILVDDGSPDNSPIICDNLAKEYGNIRVIHKENGGLSSARNAGIFNLSDDTKYVFFLDSDDTIMPNAVEEMVQIAENENSSVVMPYKYLSFIEGDEKTIKEKLLYPEELCYESSINFVLHTIMGNCRGWRATGILYSVEVIKNGNCLFPVGKISEDVVFNLQFLSCINKISYYKNPSIIVLNRRGSITKSFQNGFEDTIYYIDAEAKKYIQRVGLKEPENQRYLDAMLCRSLVIFIFAIMSSHNSLNRKLKINYVKKIIRDERNRNVFRQKQIIPWFEKKKTKFVVRLVYILLRFKLDWFAILLLSFVK